MILRVTFLTIFLFSGIVGCTGHPPIKTAKIEIKDKDDVYFQFIRADVLAMSGETRKSTAELLKLVEHYPNMAFFYLLIAENYGKEKRFGEALAACEKALEINPDFADARAYLGRLYATEGKHAEAARAFSDAIKSDPKKEELYPFLANEYLALHDTGRAIDALKSMLKVDPDAVTAYFYIGVIYAEHLNKPAEALRMYQEVLAIDPGNINAHNAIADLYLKQKELKKALAKYREIAHLEPDDVAIQIRVALIHYELKEYDQAIEVFEQILKKNPEADKIRFYLGILYEGAKKNQNALAEFARVPVNSSYYKDARLHMASISRAAGNIDEAVLGLRKAIAEKGQIAEFYEYLAALFEETREYKQAIVVLEDGRESLPDEEKIVFLLGILYEKVMDRDRAIDAMRDVVKINPKNASALNYIGYTYAERGENLDEALQMVEQALVLKPDDGYITDSLGWVYFKKGDSERALKYLMKANNIVPGEPTIELHIGEVMKARGDEKGALKFYEQALGSSLKKKETDQPEIEIIRQRIEELR